VSVSIETSELQNGEPRTVPPALVALVAPEAGMERQARVGGVKLAFLIAFVAAMLSAFAQASKVDLRSPTLAKLDADGKLATMSDKQVSDEVQSAERLQQVMKVAWGVLEAPVFLLGTSLAAVALIWFLKGKIKGGAVFPVAAAALLPNAIGDLLDAGTAMARTSLDAVATLAPRTLSLVMAALGHPLTDSALKLGNALDFFSLWGAALLAYGVAEAGGIPRRRAVVGTLVAWVCFRLLTHVAAGG
jgi:Yip1 domain